MRNLIILMLMCFSIIAIEVTPFSGDEKTESVSVMKVISVGMFGIAQAQEVEAVEVVAVVPEVVKVEIDESEVEINKVVTESISVISVLKGNKSILAWIIGITQILMLFFRISASKIGGGYAKFIDKWRLAILAFLTIVACASTGLSNHLGVIEIMFDSTILMALQVLGNQVIKQATKKK